MKKTHDLHHIGEDLYSWIHRFTREELEDFAAEMANGAKEIADLEHAKKISADDFKQRIDAKELQVRVAARKYRDKEETCTELCSKCADYNSGEIVWKDRNTCEERGRRIMTEKERQLPLLTQAQESGDAEAVQ